MFDALIGWVQHDEEARQEYMPELLGLVRLPLIRPQVLTDHISTEEMVKACHKCRLVLVQVVNIHQNDVMLIHVCKSHRKIIIL